MAAELWATGSTAEWTDALESYETAMDAKDAQRNKPADEKKKAKEGYQTLKERDDWLMSDMRTSLEAGELSAKQLYQIFEWKCQRGKDRMNLLGSKLRALEDESVRDAFAGSCELFPADDAEPAERQKAVRAAVDALCSSKIAKPLIGVGPALAAAVLHVACPAAFVYMADDALKATDSKDTLPGYVSMCGKCFDKAAELAAEDPASGWTAAAVERAMFAAQFSGGNAGGGSAKRAADEPDNVNPSPKKAKKAKKAKKTDE